MQFDHRPTPPATPTTPTHRLRDVKPTARAEVIIGGSLSAELKRAAANSPRKGTVHRANGVGLGGGGAGGWSDGAGGGTGTSQPALSHPRRVDFHPPPASGLLVQVDDNFAHLRPTPAASTGARLLTAFKGFDNEQFLKTHRLLLTLVAYGVLIGVSVGGFLWWVLEPSALGCRAAGFSSVYCRRVHHFR